MQNTIDYIKAQLSSFYPENEINSFIKLIFNRVCKIQNHEILSCKDKKISASKRAYIEDIIEGLKKQKPIQQLLKETFFYELPFFIDDHVLIPRPETEELVELIISNHKKEPHLNILDIGTGSGCIAISLAKFLNQPQVFAIDISEDALKLVKQNAILNQVKIHFEKQDILNIQPSSNLLQNKFDIIVSNPPYVTPKEKDFMSDNVLKYEPHLALFTPEDQPLLFYEKIADLGLTQLATNGSLYFEINALLGKETCDLLAEKGYQKVKLLQDISGKDRMIHAQL